MKQTLVIVVAFLLSFTTANAVNKDNGKKVVCGKVIDKTTGEALIGVKVEIKGTNTCCYTDLNGSFVLSVNIDAKQEIEANVIGYEQVKVNIADLGFNKDINLKPIQ